MNKARAILLCVLLAGCRVVTTPSSQPASAPPMVAAAPGATNAAKTALPLPPLPSLSGIAASSSAAKRLLVVKSLQAAVTPAQPNPYLQDVVLDMDLPTNQPFVLGVVVYAGNQSGQYRLKLPFPLPEGTAPATNEVTVSNMDSRLPWFFNATTYYTNGRPVSVRGLTNAAATTTVTNWLIESGFCNEVMLVDSNEIPNLSLSNGVAVLLGYGTNGLTYTVYGSTLPFGPWAQVWSTVGTNGPWQYIEPVTPGSGFFKITCGK